LEWVEIWAPPAVARGTRVHGRGGGVIRGTEICCETAKRLRAAVEKVTVCGHDTKNRRPAIISSSPENLAGDGGDQSKSGARTRWARLKR